MINEKSSILGNEQVGPRLYLMKLTCPAIASAVEPGQFVHMLIPEFSGHVLRRPFSIYAADVCSGTVDILYQVVGEGTRHMAALDAARGLAAELIGPIGCGWAVPEGATRALIVGGGVGAAPVFMLTQALASAGVDTTVVLGAQTESALVTRARYLELLKASPACTDDEPRCATDDGSFGRAGFCTSLVVEALAEAQDAGKPYDYLAVCGPEPLMRIVAGLALDAGVPAQVSMEKRMACGVGACLSCVVDTTGGKRRSCVDGPVFDAKEVLW